MKISEELSKQEVNEIKSLRLREGRQAAGCVIAEGYPEVKRAISAKVDIEKLFVCPELLREKCEEFDGYRPIVISKSDFEKIAFGKRLKGILAICKPRQQTLHSIALKKNPFFLVLQGVEKPGNLGTVIRSGDGAGVDAIICCDQKTDIFNQHVVRSSIGALFHVPVISASNEETLSFLKGNRIKIFAASSRAKTNYFDCDFTGPCAVMLGNENSGISPFFLEQADELVKIPMRGVSACLNVAMSASILAFEVDRQRRTVK